MDTTILAQKANLLNLQVNISLSPTQRNVKLTSCKFLCGTVYFQIQAYCARCQTQSSTSNSIEGSFVISAKYTKILKNDNLIYKCNLSTKLYYTKTKQSFTDEDCWHQILYHSIDTRAMESTMSFYFDVTIDFEIATFVTPFASMYEDTKLTDFELQGEGGSVFVHSAIVAGFSPVFKKMLSGNWKETSNRSMAVTDTTKETLQHFKDYIYLDKLPEKGLEDLLLLGSFYLMPDLVQKCFVKLMQAAETGNIVHLIRFAVTYKVDNLLVAILKIVQNKVVDVDVLPDDKWEDICEATNKIVKE